MFKFLGVVVMVVSFLVFSIPVLLWQNQLAKKNLEKKDRQSTRIVQWMFQRILQFAGVHITVKGLEKVPMDRAVLYVGNHRSCFDILVGYATIPGSMGFVAKKEMLKWPLLRDWMRNVNCLFLDRQNMKEGLKTILAGIELVKRGVSVFIFPEGTRSRGDDLLEMLPFKEGSLKIAEKSGCPVVPVAITGTAEIFEKQFPRVKSAHVTIEFGEPFIIKELEPEHRKFAGAYTQGLIREMLERERRG